MARQRSTEILAAESIAVAGTRTLDLNVRDPISRLSICIKVTNATTTPVGHPAEVIKKISVVDGSDVLFEMTGAEAAALGFFKTKMQPADILNYQNLQMPKFTADIFFGRYLWDRELAVDPKNHHNLQLRVTHDKALGGNTPTTGEMFVRADVFDEDPPTPIGYMCAKEQYRFTQVANTWYYVDLPTDFDISMLMLGCQNTTEAPNFNFSEFKVSQDQDKHIVAEFLMHDYMQYISPFYPPWIDKIYGNAVSTGARNHFCAPTYERRMAFVQNNDVNSTFQVPSAQGQTIAILAEVSGGFEGLVSGDCPQGMFPIPFGHQHDMEDYWRAIPGGSKRIDIKCAGAPDVSQTAKVITEQKRTY